MEVGKKFERELSTKLGLKMHHSLIDIFLLLPLELKDVDHVYTTQLSSRIGIIPINNPHCTL